MKRRCYQTRNSSSSSKSWRKSSRVKVGHHIGLRYFWHTIGLVQGIVIIKINFFYFQFSVSQFTWQIWQTNQTNQIESWIKHRCCAWVQKRVCHHRGSNSRPRAWHSVPMIRAECDTTQLFGRPKVQRIVNPWIWGSKIQTVEQTVEGKQEYHYPLNENSAYCKNQFCSFPLNSSFDEKFVFPNNFISIFTI